MAVSMPQKNNAPTDGETGSDGVGTAKCEIVNSKFI